LEEESVVREATFSGLARRFKLMILWYHSRFLFHAQKLHDCKNSGSVRARESHPQKHEG